MEPIGRRWILLVVCVFFMGPQAASAESFTPFERWYVVQLSGERVGYARMMQAPRGTEIVTAMRIRMEIRRGPTPMQMDIRSGFYETPGGKPRRAELRMNFGAMQVAQSLWFEPDGSRRLVARQGDREQEQSLPPIEGDWMTPAAASRYVEGRIAERAERINLRTIDLGSGPDPIDIELTVIGAEEVEVFGRIVPAMLWESRIAQMPGLVTREHVDERGQSLKSTVTIMPGMEITLLAADEQLASSPFDPPEILAAMFLAPDRPIANPREQRRQLFDVLVTTESMQEQIKLPRVGYQDVNWIGDQTARVTVDLDAPVQADAGGGPGDAERGASIMIDPTDPKIVELVDRALGTERDALAPAQRAERLRRLVHRHMIGGDLSVGLATASEAVRTRKGDCTEHAVLLAAALRAAGIPSRTATGLLYVDEFLGHRDVFGGHMWTQAWLPDEAGAERWVDLDATLSDQPTDAARITLGVSAMTDGQTANDFVMLSMLLAGLEIRVLEP